MGGVVKEGHPGPCIGSGAQTSGRTTKTLQSMRKCEGTGNDDLMLNKLSPMLPWDLLALYVIR